MNILDKLLENIYYEGQKPFTPPFAKPFAPSRTAKPNLSRGVEVPAPSEIPELGPTETVSGIPKESIMAELEAASDAKLDLTAAKSNMVEKLAASFPAEKPPPSFWSKLLYPVTKTLSFVEKVDATTYGLVRGIFSSAIKGRTLDEELNPNKEDKSIWQAAQDYTHGLKTWEQFLGEIVISPFNLIPANAIAGGAAKSLGRMSSFIARTQVEGATTLTGRIATKIIGYPPGYLRARVSHRLSEYMGDLLSKTDRAGRNAIQEFSNSEARGVVRRVQALAEADEEYLKTIYRDRSVKVWLNNPETREVRAYLNKAIQKGTLDLRDYKLTIGGGIERTAAQVEGDIFLSVQRAVAPLTRDTASGALGGTGIIQSIGNPFYHYGRFMVKQMNPFILLTRPAFTVYNQLTNFYMLMERHAMDALRYILEPSMKGVRAKEFWGVVPAPVMVREGMGYSYLAGLEALEKGEEIIGAIKKAKGTMKTVPLFGTGSFFKAIRDLHDEYMRAPASQRPWMERVIPLLKSYDAWIRAVNVAGEQYYRSAIFFFTHRKTYDTAMDNMLKRMGVDRPGMIQLAKGGNMSAYTSKPVVLMGVERPQDYPGGFWKTKPIEEQPVWRTEGTEPGVRPSKAYSSTKEGAYAEAPGLAWHPEMEGFQKNQYNVTIQHPLEVDDQLQIMTKWATAGDEMAKKIVKSLPDLEPSEWFVKADTYIAEKAGKMGFDGAIYKQAYAGKEYVVFDPKLVVPRTWLKPSDLVSMEGLPPIIKAALEYKIEKLAENHGVHELLSLFDELTEELATKAKNFKYFVGMHGDALSLDETIDDLFYQAKADRALNEKLAAASPQQQAFMKKIRSRKWDELTKKVDKLAGPQTEEAMKLREAIASIDSAYRERILLINTKHKLQVESYKDWAAKQGKKVLQSDVQDIYNKMYQAQMDEFDFWYAKKGEMLDHLEQVTKEHGGVLSLDDLDDYFVGQTAAITEVLKSHGIDPAVAFGDSPIKMDEYVDLFTSQSMDAINKCKTQTLMNWDDRMRNKFPDYLTESDIQLMHNEAMSYAYREAVRTTENDLFNYSTRNNLDWLMSTVSPYPFWQTRFIVHFATRCLDNPKQFNAMMVLINKWADATKDLPSFLMASPVKIPLPDGGEIRFSPYQFFFPLGYGVSSIERYSDQANDAMDAIAQIQDLAGGYLMPHWEILMGLTNNFGLPTVKSRGTGLARQPVEVIKDIIPQLKLLRGFMGLNPASTKFAVEHGMTSEGEMVQAIRAIGDALNTGELTDTVAAQRAIDSIYDGYPDELALKYYNKILGRKLPTDILRYVGAPVSYWSSSAKKSWEGQKALYPDTETPTAPDVRKKLLESYPGLEVVRGNIVPAGLDKNQEKRWRAAREYFATMDIAKAQRDEALKILQENFDNPRIGATVTGAEYRSRRKDIFQEYFGSLETGQERARQLNAPITTDERNAFWRKVGRKVYPIHPLDLLVDDYYSIDAAEFVAPDGGTDWEGYFAARKDFMDSLKPWERKWLEDYLTDPSRPDARYIEAQKLAQPYWNLKNAALIQDEDLSYLDDVIEYYSQVNPALASVFRKSPKWSNFQATLKLLHKYMRQGNPALDAALVRYWGYQPLETTQSKVSLPTEEATS